MRYAKCHDVGREALEKSVAPLRTKKVCCPSEATYGVDDFWAGDLRKLCLDVGQYGIEPSKLRRLRFARWGRQSLHHLQYNSTPLFQQPHNKPAIGIGELDHDILSQMAFNAIVHQFKIEQPPPIDLDELVQPSDGYFGSG